MKRVVKNGKPGSRQAHMNTTKFDPNKYKHKQEQVPEKLLGVMTTLCCHRCCEIIQWKVDYGKYTPLEMARKCNLCGQRTVSLAYHRICQPCATREARCAKCQKRAEELLLLDNTEERDEECLSETDDTKFTSAKEDRFLFVLQEPHHDELKRLRGLDVRVLERKIEETLRQEREDEIRGLSERKRRTVLRAQEQEMQSDDDDELL